MRQRQVGQYLCYALFIAAKNGHWEVVRRVLEAGAVKDAASTHGTTAFHFTAQNGFFF